MPRSQEHIYFQFSVDIFLVKIDLLKITLLYTKKLENGTYVDKMRLLTQEFGEANVDIFQFTVKNGLTIIKVNNSYIIL